MNNGASGNGAKSRTVTILNQYGIHARPAAMIVKAASRFSSELYIEKDGNRVSGKSIMGLMTLEASRGSKLIIVAEGEDAEQLLDEIEEMVKRRFDED